MIHNVCVNVGSITIGAQSTVLVMQNVWVVVRNRMRIMNAKLGFAWVIFLQKLVNPKMMQIEKHVRLLGTTIALRSVVAILRIMEIGMYLGVTMLIRNLYPLADSIHISLKYKNISFSVLY